MNGRTIAFTRWREARRRWRVKSIGATGDVGRWMFSDMIELAEGFGFRLSRTDDSHHIFVHPDIPELVNLQEMKRQAKPYQVRQFLKLVERHSLKLAEDK